MWSAGNSNATVSAGTVTGVTAGVDVITYSGSVFIYTGSDSCAFPAMAAKTVTINPSPTPVVSGFGGQLTTGSSYISYQWLFASAPILGATDSTYNPVSNGNYAVTVTDTDGCAGTSTAVYDANVSVPAVSTSANGISIYPNPVSSVLNVESPTKVNVLLTDLHGKVIAKKVTPQKLIWAASQMAYTSFLFMTMKVVQN